MTGESVVGIVPFSTTISPSSLVSIGWSFTSFGNGMIVVGSINGNPMCPSITAPTPAVTAARKGTSSTAFKRSRVTSISGRPRCESVAVSPWPGKCFAVAITPALCVPWMKAATYFATSVGSSPYERTLMTGFAALLFTSATGA